MQKDEVSTNMVQRHKSTWELSEQFMGMSSIM